MGLNSKLAQKCDRLNYLVRKFLLCGVIFSLVLLGGCSNAQEVTDAAVTKITLWHGINPPENRVIFQRLISKFNQQHSDLEVDAIYIGQPDAQLPKILAATISNQPPRRRLHPGTR